jgi:hypothetical protein
MVSSKVEGSQLWELAKQIVELDVLRDEKWEHLNQLAGANAHELLRRVQNS